MIPGRQRPVAFERSGARIRIRLGSEERDLIVLCGLEGLPLQDVAARLGLGLEAVTKRWQRLRERLSTGPGPSDILK